MKSAILWLIAAAAIAEAEILLRPTQKERPYLKAIYSVFVLVGLVILVCVVIWKQPKVIKYTGTLIPNPNSIQPLSSPLFPQPEREKLSALEVGDTCSILLHIGKGGELIPKILERFSLVIESTDEQVKVSTKFFDRNGDFVAGLDQNVWEVNPRTSYKFNYTDEALEVIDARNEVILQVRALPDRVQLQGEWWNDKGDGIRIAQSADIPEPSIVWWAKGEDRNLERVPPIKRIFKYPAEEHLGETIVPLIQAPPIENCVPYSIKKLPVFPRPPHVRR